MGIHLLHQVPVLLRGVWVPRLVLTGGLQAQCAMPHSDPVGASLPTPSSLTFVYDWGLQCGVPTQRMATWGWAELCNRGEMHTGRVLGGDGWGMSSLSLRSTLQNEHESTKFPSHSSVLSSQCDVTF